MREVIDKRPPGEAHKTPLLFDGVVEGAFHRAWFWDPLSDKIAE